MRKLNRQLQTHEEKSIGHKQDVLPGKLKAKNPNYHILCISMDHVTISYKAQLIELSVQYTIVSHCHTKIGSHMHQFTASTAQSLLKKNL